MFDMSLFKSDRVWLMNRIHIHATRSHTHNNTHQNKSLSEKTLIKLIMIARLTPP